MFETLFSYPSVIRRHRQGPLAAERLDYLRELEVKGMARGTILRHARYCLCLSVELGRWPPNHVFNEEEIDALTSRWATERVEKGRASSARWPAENFGPVARDFLRTIGRLCSPPTPSPWMYEGKLVDFVAAKQQGRWLSAATCGSARWQVRKFLDYLEQRNVALADVSAADIDAYFEHMAQRWSRVSLHTSGTMLRAWFAHCEARGWVKRGLASSIMLPRIYRHEGLPLGPTWDEVGQMLTETSGDDPTQLRDHAIILLLSVYGLRSGEVRNLLLDDIDWPHGQFRVIRSKTGREETLPIEPRVGNAIARYLRHGRPKSTSRVVFLTLLAPHRPLSAGGLYYVVERHLTRISSPKKGRGPHGLRHACARHLLDAGRSFKEVGDHLGHRSPDSTRIYAKVDLASLRKVAFPDLGGLV